MNPRNKPRKKRSLIWALEKSELEKLVANSTSLGEILRFFSLQNKGGNSSTLKKRLIEENIDFSHITLGIGSNKGKNFSPAKTPLSEILTTNSTYSRTHLKNRLLCEEILDNVCSECGQNGIWNDKPLRMVLDHINGISDDNRIENLRMLCPNCNSQMDTFSGRNKKYSRTGC